MPKPLRIAALALIAAAFPASALAHVSDQPHAHGWVAGALHPLGGLDHLAAMIGVGLWAARRGGASLWLIPAAFVAGMAGGLTGLLPASALPIETGVMLSLVALGALLAFAIELPLAACIALAAAAGLLHGAAHASEVSTGEGIAGFAIGALAMTALLHTGGAFAGAGLRKRAPQLMRIAGIAMATLGVALAVQAG